MSLGSLAASAQGSVMVPAAEVEALSALSWAFIWGEGIATFVALWEG